LFSAGGTGREAHFEQRYANQGDTVPTFVIEIIIANKTSLGERGFRGLDHERFNGSGDNIKVAIIFRKISASCGRVRSFETLKVHF
jgi:hypothetical protein